MAFEPRRNRMRGGLKRRSSRGRHRRTARLWPAWLPQVLPEAKIWSGWTEVTAGRVRPDALRCGFLDGRETLFWLEVESGHFSRSKLSSRTIFRIIEALLLARRAPVQLVFTLLGPAWMRKAVAATIGRPPQDLTVLVADWKSFGKLPKPSFGEVRDWPLA